MNRGNVYRRVIKDIEQDNLCTLLYTRSIWMPDGVFISVLMKRQVNVDVDFVDFLDTCDLQSDNNTFPSSLWHINYALIECRLSSIA